MYTREGRNKDVIEMLKNNKALGEDIKGTELLNNGGELIVNDIWELVRLHILNATYNMEIRKDTRRIKGSSNMSCIQKR